MTNTKEIRAALKLELRYNAKQVSVKENRGGYSYSFTFTIRKSNVDKEAVEKFVSGIGSVDRCEKTREILSGGNIYTTLNVTDEVKKEWAGKYLDIVTDTINNLEDGQTVDVGEISIFKPSDTKNEVVVFGIIKNGIKTSRTFWIGESSFITIAIIANNKDKEAAKIEAKEEETVLVNAPNVSIVIEEESKEETIEQAEENEVMQDDSTNTYKKYCPNVFVAKCETEYKKGDIIIVETKYGNEHECLVHNFVGYVGTKEEPFYCYSITRVDGFNSQERAKNKAEKLSGYALNAIKRSNDWYEKSNEGRDFLALGEPIKVGHHSEKRHRKLISRNWARMGKSVEEQKKAESYESRIKYWESMANKIDLSMPESLEYFKFKLEKAEAEHKYLKDNPSKRAHMYSLTYAKKDVNENKKKLATAVKLWG